MIDQITVIGANGSQVQLNTDNLQYPIQNFEVTYDSRSDDTPKVQEHGTWPAFDYIDTMHLLIEGQLLAQDAGDYWSKRRTLLAPFSPVPEQGIRSTCRVIVQLTGFPEILECDFSLDGQRPDIPLNSEIPAVSNFQINLKARDPRWLGQFIQSTNLSPPSATLAGFSVPFTLPLNLDNSAGSTTTSVINAGDLSTYPTMLVYGPCSSPSFSVFRPDGSQQIWALQNLFIPDGQYVIADFGETSVLLNGNSSAYSKLAPYSEWWHLGAGLNTVEFNCLNATSATPPAQVNWQNAYMI